MSEEFKKTGADTATSPKGFAVQVTIASGVWYRDADGEKHISSEWLAKPSGIILYKGSRGNTGFEKLEQSRIDSIFFDVARALEYLGHRVEIWSSPSGPDERQRE